MPTRQNRLKEWLGGASIALALIMAALSFAYTYGSSAKALEEHGRRLADLEAAKLAERLGRIEGTLELIVRGLGLRPVAAP
jgi:hypothetical protein